MVYATSPFIRIHYSDLCLWGADKGHQQHIQNANYQKFCIGNVDVICVSYIKVDIDELVGNRKKAGNLFTKVSVKTEVALTLEPLPRQHSTPLH